MTTLRLLIQLGNDAMQNGDDVAEALCGAADRIRQSDPESSGAILDRNGNTVGAWSFDAPTKETTS